MGRLRLEERWALRDAVGFTQEYALMRHPMQGPRMAEMARYDNHRSVCWLGSRPTGGRIPVEGEAGPVRLSTSLTTVFRSTSE